MTLTAGRLAFSYGRDREVFRGVDLTLREGSMDFLVGPNGSGKSTLLALLAGALTPAEGEVFLDGRPLLSIPPPERASLLGWLPQGAGGEAFGFTVEETVALGLEAGRPGLALPGRRELERVRETLDLLDLAGLAGRPLERLSGGERQRARLAAVLAPDRPFLLLDEPTAALDPHMAVQALEVLEPLARQGKALLVVSHDLNLASLFGERIHLLASGRILASGPPGEVLRRELLEEAYGPGLVLVSHPGSGRPALLPGRSRKEERP